jgi:hypothetical protein
VNKQSHGQIFLPAYLCQTPPPHVTTMQELANGGTLLHELQGGYLKDQATGHVNMTLVLQVCFPIMHGAHV